MCAYNGHANMYFDSFVKDFCVEENFTKLTSKKYLRISKWSEGPNEMRKNLAYGSHSAAFLICMQHYANMTENSATMPFHLQKVDNEPCLCCNINILRRKKKSFLTK